MLGVAVGRGGGNSRYKAPSSSQQAQIGAEQQSLQNVISQLMNVLPVLFQVHSHPVPTTPTPVTIVQPAPPPVAVPPPVQPQAFTQPPTVPRSFRDTFIIPLPTPPQQ